MKKISLTLCLFTFTLLHSQQITCDTTNCTKQKTSKYEIELIKKCSTHLNVYVNDRMGKPLINTDIIGYIAFFYKGGDMVTEELFQFPQSNYLEAEIPRTGFYNFKVSLIINGETVSAFFDNECTLRTLMDVRSQ